MQNRVQTQNMGEETQLEVKTQESLRETEVIPRSRAINKEVNEQMGTVAKKVQILLSDESNTGGIGQEVKEVAQQQQEAQQEMEKELNKLKSRWTLTRRILGTNRNAVRTLEQIREKNKERIKTVERLRLQAGSEGNQLQETEQALEIQNEYLTQLIETEKENEGFWGWVRNLF